ncbi:carcinoembryonic antigen-related cell adhesion molecule 3-like [Mesocricetus auratus]|uniref:Carcinoembryonic antigen-related cell adhesion molecule 3-like n=1 Tax=Mesocricetus auratus TaxID=10036 RepID=A0ABM2WN22_MESAU|nr:carcinoembryonic antigen-related cell adhesion molecule 3-like [Mesocricetus auratus]
METSFVLLCNGYSPWQGLLLTASLLTCWHISTSTAHVTIESVPPHVVEGENVLLLVDNLPENLATLVWSKGVKITDNIIGLYALNKGLSAPGPLHSGRETLYHNGSLLLRNVTWKDTGSYTLQTLNRQEDIVSTTTIDLHVHTSYCGCPCSSAQITIESIPSSIVEGTNVLLVAHNIPENLRSFFWYKGGIVFKSSEIVWHIKATNSTVLGPAHSGREIVYSNGSLLLQNFTWADTGFYTLRTLSRDMKTELAHVQLQVDTSHCHHYPTSAQPTIESVPPSAAEGGSALLVVHSLPKNILAIYWYKGTIVIKDHEIAKYSVNTNSRPTNTVGLAHSGRETLYSNGSLLIQNLTRSDTGSYTLKTLTRDGKVGLTQGQLLVDTSLSVCCNPLTSVQLMIEPVPQNAVKGESVLLLVHNLPKNMLSFAWFKSAYSIPNYKIVAYRRDVNYIYKGPLYSRRAMVYPNGSLLLQDVMESDAGIYTLQIFKSDLHFEIAYILLHVYTCRIPPSQLFIDLMTPNVLEGTNALLLVHNIPENLQAFSWYKEVNILTRHLIAWKEITDNESWLGPAYSRRVTVYPNGSLVLYNTTQNDTGLYTLQTLNTQFKTQETHVYLHIYKPVTQPFIQVTSTTVTAQNSVVLSSSVDFTCLADDTGVSIRWIFNNQSLQFTDRMTLSPTKCALFINPVRREDTGDYQCEVFNPVSSKTSLPFSLVVRND